MDIPHGTTHVFPADETAFNQTPTYMRWGYWFTSQLEEDPNIDPARYCWHHWHRGQWHRDLGFSDRHKRLVPIADFKSAA
jgi:hypothetical protein